MTRTYSVTAIVRSLNKPAEAEHVLVRAENEDDAKTQAKNKIQRDKPAATVQVGKVRPR